MCVALARDKEFTWWRWNGISWERRSTSMGRLEAMEALLLLECIPTGPAAAGPQTAAGLVAYGMYNLDNGTDSGRAFSESCWFCIQSHGHGGSSGSVLLLSPVLLTLHVFWLACGPR